MQPKPMSILVEHSTSSQPRREPVKPEPEPVGPEQTESKDEPQSGPYSRNREYGYCAPTALILGHEKRINGQWKRGSLGWNPDLKGEQSKSLSRRQVPSSMSLGQHTFIGCRPIIVNIQLIKLITNRKLLLTSSVHIPGG